MITQIEEDQGTLPPNLPRGISPEAAAENKDVQTIIAPRLNMLIAKRAEEIATAQRTQASSSLPRRTQPSQSSGSQSRSAPIRPPTSPSPAQQSANSASTARSARDNVVAKNGSSSRKRPLSGDHSSLDESEQVSEKAKGKRRVRRGSAGGHVSLYPERWTVHIPPSPSRSPTPPTRVEAGGRGNKYTEEDKDYFIKFIQWRLKKDPTLEKDQLCALTAEKVRFLLR